MIEKIKSVIIVVFLVVIFSASGFCQNQSFTDFITNAPTISQPLGSSSVIPVVRAGTTKKIHLLSFTSPYDFEAKCDGVTDDAIAIQKWYDAASDTVGLIIPSATCKTNTCIVRSNINFKLTIIGMSPYQSVIRYGGTSTTCNILGIGGSDSTGFNAYLSNFKITSDTVMTAGAGIYMEQMGNSILQNIILSGQQDGVSKLWNSFYANKVDSIYISNPDWTAQNDCLVANGSVGAGAKADITLTGGGKLVNCVSGAAIHIAGAFGGFVCGTMNIAHSGIGVLIDTSLASERNREIFLGKSCIIDAAQLGPLVKVNDSLSSNGTLEIAGWLGTTISSNMACVDMVNWNGQLTVSSPEIFNCTGDGIRLRTSSTYLSTASSTQIHDNGGYGIKCDTVTNLPRSITAPFANTSGDYGPDCAIEPIPLRQGGTADNGSSWATFSPGLTCSGGGSISNYSPEGHYKTLGKTVWFSGIITINNIGTCAGPYLQITAPCTASHTSGGISGREALVTGKSLAMSIPGSSNLINTTIYDFSTAIVNNYVLTFGGTYECS